ncbi:MAG: energy transducer TonB [Chitinispirillaceae bacterium]
MKSEQSNSPVPLYEPENQREDSIFAPLLLLSLLAFLGLGIYMRNRPAPAPQVHEKSREGIETSFIVPEEKPKPPPPPPPKAEKPEEKPVDLMDKPVPDQKEEVRVDKAQQEKKAPDKKKKARPVYGIRKVYSRGLGASGSAGDAVIGKLGNTLNKSIDSDTATPEDLQGQVVSVTTVSRYPVMKRKPRLEYTAEMLENKVEGVIRVKCLVDTDGAVKKAIPQNDLGYGSKEVARKACLDAHFDPALRDGKPVAVWIAVPIKFEILG